MKTAIVRWVAIVGVILSSANLGYIYGRRPGLAECQTPKALSARISNFD